MELEDMRLAELSAIAYSAWLKLQVLDSIKKQEQECVAIAEKIMKGERLTNEEKERAYLALTGKHSTPRNGRGRPSTGERDVFLAAAYHTQKGNSKNREKLKLKLARDSNINSERIDSIDKAIQRGTKVLLAWITAASTCGSISPDELRRNDRFREIILQK